MRLRKQGSLCITTALCALVAAGGTCPLQANVLITELMASNRTTLVDSDGDSSDWIEVTNTGDTAVEMGGYYLTNNPENLRQWRLPPLRLSPGARVVIFASEKNRDDPGDELHTNFRLDADGEFLGLVASDGETIAHQFAPRYPQQQPDISFGITGGDPAQRAYFTSPTPGGPNSAGVPGVTPDPQFSRESHAYTSNFNLTLSTGTPGVEIRYTTDGREPTPSSTRYDGPISIANTVTVKAKAYREGLLSSRTVEQSYVKLASNVADFDSNLPLFLVNTFGRSIGSSFPTSLGGAVHIHAIDVGADGRSRVTAPADFSGRGAIKTRGSSTGGRDKASYAFEVWDSFGEDRDVEILGFPAESDWILYGPYNFDRALMRNAFIYELSNRIGRYAVRTQFCELFVNSGTGSLSSSHYRGVYVFMEKIKRGRDRVDVERLSPGDNAEPRIAGGWILKIDRADPGDSGFSAAGQTLRHVYPKEEETTSTQRTWIRNWFNEFGSALNGTNFRHPELGYRRYIEVDDWIDHHILNVYAKNVDALRLSTFMHKKRFGKLAMGPIWDFDRSMESYDGRDDSPESWSGSSGTQFFSYPWWDRLFQDPDFWQAWRDRWEELRGDEFHRDEILGLVDSMANELREAAERNFDRWNLSLRNNSYQAEVDHIKDWLDRRLTWIDAQFPRPPVPSSPDAIITPGFELAMSAPAGTVYYTLDGSDPRLAGGGVSPAAEEFGTSDSEVLLDPDVDTGVRVLVPTDDSVDGSWTAAGFDDSSWTFGAGGIGVGYERNSGYEGLFVVDVESGMYEGNTSVYVRIAFDVDDPSLFSFLTLGMMYDDGFIAYLNGTRVASANAPSSPAWNDSATGQNGDGAAVSFQDFNISEHVGRLVSGTNVLAIHGLNANTTSSDLLLVPRLLASGAFSGEPIVLDGFTRVTARTRLGSAWSGPSVGTFGVEEAMSLRVTELMYHPDDGPLGTPFADEDFEFVEIENIGATPVDLRGVHFSEGIEFDFTASDVTTLPPGEFVVVVSHREAFESVHDVSGILVAGEYSGNLENRGETLTLSNAAGATIQEFRYDDAWHPLTDGDGYSLVIADSLAARDAWSTAAGWQASDQLLGTPGAPDDFSGGRQLPGDANQDSSLDIGDAVTLLLLLFRAGEASLPCDGETVADGSNAILLDFNDDSGVDSSDVVHLLIHLFRQGPPHAQGELCLRIEGCPSACAR